MFFVIAKVHDGPRDAYVREKIRRSVASVMGESIQGTSFLEDQIAALEGFEMPPIALVDPSRFPEIDRAQERAIEVAQACALQEVTIATPLLDGEEVLDDAFTYLEKPFEEFRTGTAILARRTNKAELLYLFPNATIGPDGLTHHVAERGGADGRAALEASGPLGGMIGNIIRELLGKAASAAGEEIGAEVFNLVIELLFHPDDTAAFVEAVQKVVKDEIESNEVDKINGRIEGTILYLTDEYQVRREKSDLSKPEDRRDLLDSLGQYSRAFYTEVMGILEQARYAQRGLRSYMLGASIHLIITQEMALVDWKETNPNESSYAGTLRANAKHYREHVESTVTSMLNARLEKIGWGNMPDHACGRTGCHVTRDAWAWWDKETHEGEKFYDDQHKKPPYAKDLAERAAASHRAAVRAAMLSDLGDPPSNAIPSLKKLETFRFPV